MTMIEKAAKALCLYVEGRDDVWDDLSADDRSPYFDMARAVLMAVMEPGDCLISGGGAEGDQIWQETIDAILSGQPE